MQHVLVVGGVSWDTIVDLDGFPEPRPQTLFARGHREALGSTGAGKALNLARLGIPVTLHGTLGDDPWGERIRARLGSEPLECAWDLDPAGTERHLNLMAADGGRISIYLACAGPEPRLDRPRLERLIRGSDLVALNIIGYCRSLIPAIRAAGRPLWCDIHDWDGKNPYHRDFVDAADVLFFSTESMTDPRAFMTAQIVAGKQLVVATRGRQGAWCLTAEGQWTETPALPVQAVADTNGAGDAFFAGFLYGHLHGEPPDRCMQLGARAAALCVESVELASPSLTPSLLTGR